MCEMRIKQVRWKFILNRTDLLLMDGGWKNGEGEERGGVPVTICGNFNERAGYGGHQRAHVANVVIYLLCAPLFS